MTDGNNSEYKSIAEVEQENRDMGLNIHQPGTLRNALNHLTKAAHLLNMLGSEDWSTDIEQTRDSIEREFVDAKNRWLDAVHHTSETNRNKEEEEIER